MTWSGCTIRGPVALFACAVVLILTGCGGGGGGGGGGTPTGVPQPGITFTASGTPGADAVYLRRSTQSTASKLLLEVVANDVTDLFAVGFDLNYPGSILSYAKVTQGSFLSNSGNVKTSLQIAERQKGTLVIGLTRLGGGSGRSGSGVLMTITFAAAGSGSGTFTYDNQAAYSSDIRQTGEAIAGFQFLAGSVTVQQ